MNQNMKKSLKNKLKYILDFKSLGYRKFANNYKSMQFCKPFVQKKVFPLQIFE